MSRHFQPKEKIQEALDIFEEWEAELKTIEFEPPDF